MWELVCVCWVGVRWRDECGTKVRAGTPQLDAVMAELINNAARYRSFIFGWFFSLFERRFKVQPLTPSPCRLLGWRSSCFSTFSILLPTQRAWQWEKYSRPFRDTDLPPLSQTKAQNRVLGGCFFDQHSSSPPTWTNRAIINTPIGSCILYLPFPSAIMWGSD